MQNLIDLTIVQLIKKAQDAYYSGNPIMSDLEYDYLVLQHPDAEKVIGTRGDTKHVSKMYSLQKYYEGKDVIPSTVGYVETLKLDGLAVELVYLNGVLFKMVTRGDGELGNDITWKADYINGIPASIDTVAPLHVVTGEVLSFNTEIPNARNQVAGVLVSCKDPAEVEKKAQELDIKFVAYDSSTMCQVLDKYTAVLDMLASFGFLTVDQVQEGATPTDGLVYRVNSNKKFQEMGFTAKFPRGAFAVKTIQEGVVTKLIDVVWQTGGSGKVTPVAILEPVEMDDGCVVSRATLNNIAYIDALGLELGCMVRVIRAGEVIPKIVEKVESE